MLFTWHSYLEYWFYQIQPAPFLHLLIPALFAKYFTTPPPPNILACPILWANRIRKTPTHIMCGGPNTNNSRSQLVQRTTTPTLHLPRTFIRILTICTTLLYQLLRRISFSYMYMHFHLRSITLASIHFWPKHRSAYTRVQIYLSHQITRRTTSLKQQPPQPRTSPYPNHPQTPALA